MRRFTMILNLRARTQGRALRHGVALSRHTLSDIIWVRFGSSPERTEANRPAPPHAPAGSIFPCGSNPAPRASYAADPNRAQAIHAHSQLRRLLQHFHLPPSKTSSPFRRRLATIGLRDARAAPAPDERAPRQL
jgi:hypothetical protein